MERYNVFVIDNDDNESLVRSDVAEDDVNDIVRNLINGSKDGDRVFLRLIRSTENTNDNAGA